MPVTKQATKKVRQDKRKTQINARKKLAYKKAVSAFRKKPSAALLVTTYRALDLAAKTNVIHKNKSSRLKSRLSKMLKGEKQASKPASATKKSKKS